MKEGERKRTLNYSCNKIAKQHLAKWKVGVKKETSGDFSQLRLIVAAGERRQERARGKKKLHDIFLQLCTGAGYGRRVGTFGVPIVS